MSITSDIGTVLHHSCPFGHWNRRTSACTVTEHQSLISSRNIIWLIKGTREEKQNLWSKPQKRYWRGKICSTDECWGQSNFLLGYSVCSKLIRLSSSLKRSCLTVCAVPQLSHSLNQPDRYSNYLRINFCWNLQFGGWKVKDFYTPLNLSRINKLYFCPLLPLHLEPKVLHLLRRSHMCMCVDFVTCDPYMVCHHSSNCGFPYTNSTSMLLIQPWWWSH